MADKVVEHIDLDYPIKDGGGIEITALEMRRPKVKDSREAQKVTGKDAEAFEIILFARLCGLTIEDIEELDMLDYSKIQKRFQKMVGADKGNESSDTDADQVE